MAIGLKLCSHHAVCLSRIVRRSIDEMHKHPAALDVPEKSVAEACALVRAFDQPGNIGDDEFPTVDCCDPELRMERSEGIIRDFRLGSADGCQESGFPRIRQAYDAGVSNQLQPQPDGTFFS